MFKKNPLIIFALYFVLYEVTVYLSNDMIMPAMPQIADQFHAPLSSIALSLTAYVIGGSTLQLFIGPIADIIGKRKVLLFGNILFLIMTIIIPFSSSMTLFLTARFFQGMGLCFIFIGYSVIHELFNDKDAVKLMSILANITIFAPLAGPLIGSSITLVSRWEFVFIISALLSILSLWGLHRYMPPGKITVSQINVREIFKSYINIVKNRTFFLGIMTSGLSIVPMISWIGLSPVMILERLHQSTFTYLGCQSTIFGGFILSSLLIQFMAGRFSFYQIIKAGSIISLIGLITAATCSWFSLYLMTFGLFIYAFGFGLYNGILIRVGLSDTGETMTMSSAVMSLIFGMFLSIGLEMANKICGYFDYSIQSFAMFSGVIGILIFILAQYFAHHVKDRAWQ